MEGIYLDGNLKLKRPTYQKLLQMGLFLDEYGLEKIAMDKKLSIQVLKGICVKTKKDFSLKGKLTPILTAKIIVDFFSIYFNGNLKGKKHPIEKLTLKEMEPFTFLTKTSSKIREQGKHG